MLNSKEEDEENNNKKIHFILFNAGSIFYFFVAG